MRTGHRAFEGTSIYRVLKSVAEGVYAPARSWRPDLPPRVEAAIDRAMRLNPAARFPSVRMLGAELLPYASAAVRAVWTPVFGEIAREVGSEGPPVGGEEPRDEVPVRVGTGTMLLREAGSVRLGTATYPPVGDLTAEDLRPPRSRAPRFVAIGVALAAAAVAVASGLRRAPAAGGAGEAAAGEAGESGVAAARPVMAGPVMARPVMAGPVMTMPVMAGPVAPLSKRQVPAVQSPAAPVPVQPAAPHSRSLPPPADRPPTRAPVLRRRKSRPPWDPRAIPANESQPPPELRTNVPIPD